MSSARSVTIDGIKIGGGAPIRIESMLKTRLDDTEGCLAELSSLEVAGCELVRTAYPDLALARSLKELVKGSKLALMADIHFDHSLALSAIECGVRSIRINPGNMKDSSGLEKVIDAARANGVVIRIGANGGSISASQLADADGDRAAALVIAVEQQLHPLIEAKFDDVIISAKSSSVPETVRANAILASRYPYPLHIGITEAGPGISGAVKSAAGIALMLAQGIGDTMRVSLTGPSTDEAEVACDILRSLELRSRGVNMISCPGCGRRRVDVFSLVERVRSLLPHDLPDGTNVAVMGCEVNGPKEAAHADIGVAGTKGGFVLFRAGEVVRTGSESELSEAIKDLFAESMQ